MISAGIQILADLGILQAIQAGAVIVIAYYLYHKFFG